MTDKCQTMFKTVNLHDLNVLFLFMKRQYIVKEMKRQYLVKELLSEFFLHRTNVVVKCIKRTTQRMLSLSSLRGFPPTQNFCEG